MFLSLGTAVAECNAGSAWGDLLRLSCIVFCPKNQRFEYTSPFFLYISSWWTYLLAVIEIRKLCLTANMRDAILRADLFAKRIIAVARGAVMYSDMTVSVGLSRGNRISRTVHLLFDNCYLLCMTHKIQPTILKYR